MEKFKLSSILVLALALGCMQLEANAQTQVEVNAQDVAEKQQVVNRLLWKIYEPLPPGHGPRNYIPTRDLSVFKDAGLAVRHLLTEFENKRMLPKRRAFSIFDEGHRNDLNNIFDVFMNFKDWKSAAEFAAFARDRVNEMQFVTAFCTFIIHSDLGRNVVIPPLYEIYPHEFVKSEVILEAYKAKMTNSPVNIPIEYTGTTENIEQRVTYFTEDIGMNDHHTTWHWHYPSWWRDSYGHHLDRKGELFYWVHNQQIARYDNERLSNGMDMVEELHWDKPIEGFYPQIMYKFGGEFPPRVDNWTIQDLEVATVRGMVRFENRIREAISYGYIRRTDDTFIDIKNDQGIDVLGDIIESSTYSVNQRHYGSIHNTAHYIIGRQCDPLGKFNMPPSAIENFETSARDPVFFRLHKRIDNFFTEFKRTLDPYSHEDLDFPGVEIISVGVEGELKTFLEPYEIDLRNAVDYGNDPSQIEIKATVDRLNHHEFSWVADVYNNNSNEVVGAFRFFLCPDYNNNGENFTLENVNWHCIEMDKFWVGLSPGRNQIVRKSKDSSIITPDRPSFQTLIDAANTGHFYMPEFTERCGFPGRMLLPKGKKDGMEYTLMLAVTNDTPNSPTVPSPGHSGIVDDHVLCPVHKNKYSDKRPMGFPIDRPIPDREVFYQTTNIGFTKVKVYHDERLH